MRRAVATALITAGLSAGIVAAAPAEPAARPGASLRLTATAYCQGGTTKSGARTHMGIVAADPQVLPVGSIVRIDSPRSHAGIYTVLDTGPAVKGHELDIFIADCARAQRFG